MMTLVLIGLVIICAKLWFEVGALRVRVTALEIGAEPNWQPDIADEALPAADPMPPQPAATVELESSVPAAAPVQEPFVELVSDEPAEPDMVEEAPAARGARFEDLFGRKLPIWAGGITLAVAGFLIVKYSVDAGLLSPVVRVVMGWCSAAG
jgi:uncharacterized membrane protein